jgi:hypothetical protein
LYSEAGVTDYVARDTYGGKAYMFADFDPNINLSIDQAAELAGYDSFNWVQNITSDTENRLGKYYAKNGLALNYPLTDPPANQTISGPPKLKMIIHIIWIWKILEGLIRIIACL